jgi:hypothetical protein
VLQLANTTFATLLDGLKGCGRIVVLILPWMADQPGVTGDVSLPQESSGVLLLASFGGALALRTG